MSVGLCAILVALPVLAERADRSKPVNLEADRITVDEGKRVHVFEGNVRLTQGTLNIEADRIVVSQDGEGFQRGLAVGSPARFRQKREGRDDYVAGEGERLEYDARTERVEFFGNALVRSGLDEVSGAYIGYDAREERYLATATSPKAATAANGEAPVERVRATIQPRVRENETASTNDANTMSLKASDAMTDTLKLPGETK